MFIEDLLARENPRVRYFLHKSESAESWAEKPELDFADPVEVTAEYWFDGRALQVKGRIRTKLSVDCARCLADMIYPVELDFSAVFAEKPDEDEGEYALVQGKALLDKCILDELILNLPAKFLCRADCKGLCPVCGINKNLGDCACDVSRTAPNSFEKLKGLFQ